MLFLDVVSNCNSTELSLILPIFKRIISLIQLIAPIILILFATIQLVQAVMNPDEKNLNKKIFNKFLAAAIIFFIPVFVNAVMSLIGASTEFSNCWNSVSTSTYVDTNTNTTNNNNESNTNTDSNFNTKSNSSGNTSSGSSDGGSSVSEVSINRYIFVGDSRTVGMYIYNSNNSKYANYSEGGAHEVGEDVYIAEVSKGLSWLKSTGITAAEKYFSESTALIILMGVNDTYNIKRYISYLNEKVNSWTAMGVKVYYVSVNPCDGKYSSNNSDIINFNSKLKANLPSGVTWIDTYSYLNSKGFKTKDGLHYDKDTSINIYNYIKSKV